MSNFVDVSGNSDVSIVVKRFEDIRNLPSDKIQMTDTDRKIALVIDVEECFSDTGSLPVKGTFGDCQNIISTIIGLGVDEIHLTIDRHTREHIAHSKYWMNSNGEHPVPYTVITTECLESRRWFPVNGDTEWANYYLTELAKRGRFPHTIWPDHGIHNSTENDNDNIVPILKTFLNLFERGGGIIHSHVKGLNNKTESFSAFGAEVPDPDDETTCVHGQSQIERMNKILGLESDKQTHVICCGEALTHCVNYTVRDLMIHARHVRSTAKFYLLVDGTSPVVIPGLCEKDQPFLHPAIDFLKWFTENGGFLIKSTDIASGEIFR